MILEFAKIGYSQRTVKTQRLNNGTASKLLTN